MNHAIQTNLSHGVKTIGERPALELHIEELVLTGFSSADRFHIADSVERELARLLEESGIPGLKENSVSVEGLDAGKFKVAPGSRAHVIGRQAAQAVHRQLSLQTEYATETNASSNKSLRRK